MKYIQAISFSISMFLLSSTAFAGIVTPELRSAVEKVQPNEKVPVIITLTDKADFSVIKTRDKINKRREIVKALKNKAGQTQGPLRALLQRSNAARIRPLWINNSIAALVPSRLVDVIASFPGVESVKVDAVIYARPVTPGVTATPEWNISAVQADDLWAQGITGNGVVVASMDTGVDYLHPDLNGNWRGGTDSWYNPYATDCVTIPGVVTCQSCDLNGATPCDAFGHGTGTVGIMTGGDVGGTSIGVAPGAQWIGVKIFADPVGTSLPAALLSAIHEGFQWVLAPGGDPARAPDVVNNSWGFDNIDNCSSLFTDGISTVDVRQDVQLVRDAGIAVVFAAGNDGPGASTSTSPANYPETFSVGATSISNTIASFSSRGPSACDGSIYPQISAPGVSVKTTDLSFGGFSFYTTVQGTSFSAPHVSGAMALLLQAYPSLVSSKMEWALMTSATDFGTTGPDDAYGFGLMNILEAYNILRKRDEVGVFRNNRWYLDVNGNGVWEPGTDKTFTFGVTGDIPVTGDWNGDGITKAGVMRGNRWYLDVNGNGVWDPGADSAFTFGKAGDIPVTGDWNGDGYSEVGVVRGNRWYLDVNGNGVWEPGADSTFTFGKAGDIPVTGDWNGDGISEAGIVRGNRWYLDMNGNGIWEPATDSVFTFGAAGDIPVAGDWNEDGITEAGTVRGNRWFLDMNGNGIWEPGLDLTFLFGVSGDIPVPGKW